MPKSNVPEPIIPIKKEEKANTIFIVRNKGSPIQVQKRSLHVVGKDLQQIKNKTKEWFDKNKEILYPSLLSDEGNTHIIGFKDLETKKTKWFSVKLAEYSSEEVMEGLMKIVK